LPGESLVDELLESVVLWKSFQDCSGDGSVIGCSVKVSTGGEEGLDKAEGAEEDVDEDGVVTSGAVVLFFEQPGDGVLEVVFDNLVSCVKMPLWRAHGLPPEKGV